MTEVVKTQFDKYVELVASMSIDYMVEKKLTKETYVNNLKMIVEQLEKEKDNEARRVSGKGSEAP